MRYCGGRGRCRRGCEALQRGNPSLTYFNKFLCSFDTKFVKVKNIWLFSLKWTCHPDTNIFIVKVLFKLNMKSNFYFLLKHS
ncbi:hypothetical protein XELAEV_18024013mg [Xenopus laevis]|uniref:Uncharacterized protein n=1 Tax=Xenopus laevis TaxID=8355 RepID=A0A974D5G8_XENLA|nr:hypothetical protein XELAEV_18024013mg [Xenopus laevis]